ncbi:PREDICTED: serine/threonine-protein phosphatase 4 regulatory subunit 2 [Nanorana parkeri]|uniref:serine/threonine-protein phosphatase 4 regulatory subunit 2 n=1 Tax=Nanorana parkeri TaxID=125878 RepID=UPI0008546572|nr:PREDICTED: serine/threonine-protein phosphatase 4 regulatory subunit 2 [Nanorana parkeri]
MFKLEKVMDDFRTSAPEPRGPPNPNVEYIPFDEMKDRILKIVTAFNGTPFTIQRLCELVTDPRRNYTGTEKFLRGVEKNIMVVSCVYPSSEKNNSPSLNRMNGVMFPGNSQNYTDRSNINGPGTPRPLSKPKLSLSSPTTSNGLPDGAENKDSDVPQKDQAHSDSLSPEEDSPSSTVKNKHLEEDPTEDHEVKRLKFDIDDEEEEQEEEDEEQAAQADTSSSQTSSEMAEETESVSTTEEAGSESSDLEHTAEESLMAPAEPTAETSDKQTSESETVSNSTSEEPLQMEESGHCEAERSLHSDEGEEAAAAESAPAPSKADAERSDTEQPGTFDKSPEIPPETPMENSEEATDVADEPMEQD